MKRSILALTLTLQFFCCPKIKSMDILVKAVVDRLPFHLLHDKEDSTARLLRLIKENKINACSDSLQKITDQHDKEQAMSDLITVRRQLNDRLNQLAIQEIQARNHTTRIGLLITALGLLTATIPLNMFRLMYQNKLDHDAENFKIIACWTGISSGFLYGGNQLQHPERHQRKIENTKENTTNLLLALLTKQKELFQQNAELQEKYAKEYNKLKQNSDNQES